MDHKHDKDTPEPNEEHDHKKRMKLPVYHAPKQNDTITIRLNIHPRRVERFFFILTILLLLAAIIFKPAFLFGPCQLEEEELESGALDEGLVALGGEEEANVTEPAPAAEVPEEEPVVEEPAEEPEVAAEDPAEEEEPTTPAPTDTKITPTKIAFQVTDFTIEKKSETWYKLKEVEIKVTNNHDIKFYPEIKVWYYDDATKSYFNEEAPAKDTQILSVGIDAKKSKTFTLSKLDESFSDSDMHPTVLVKLYDYKTGKIIKEITKIAEFEED
jgi:hypothetical protein